ncbi:unnamed protein product [Camellia sinensis]
MWCNFASVRRFSGPWLAARQLAASSVVDLEQNDGGDRRACCVLQWCSSQASTSAGIAGCIGYTPLRVWYVCLHVECFSRLISLGQWAKVWKQCAGFLNWWTSFQFCLLS